MSGERAEVGLWVMSVGLEQEDAGAEEARDCFKRDVSMGLPPEGYSREGKRTSLPEVFVTITGLRKES